MIVYSATRGKFTEDVFSNVIEGKILAAFERRLGQSTSRREIESWKGPGTGKSVVAINLLVELTRRERLAHYVTRNAAPREVYQ